MSKNQITLISAGLIAFATSGVAQNYNGELSVASRSTDYFNDDDSEDGSLSGQEIRGFVATEFGGMSVALDFATMARDLPAGDDFDDYVPSLANAVGFHAGWEADGTYFGAFLAFNEFESSDTDFLDGKNSGHAFGVEFSKDAGNLTWSGFLGRADMPVGVNGSGVTNEGFEGYFLGTSVGSQVGPVMVTANFEYGLSPHYFEDNGDAGSYTRYGAEAEYGFSDNLTIFGGLDIIDVFTHEEDDQGVEATFSIGMKYAFGNSEGRAAPKTSYAPGLAAAWADVLD